MDSLRWAIVSVFILAPCNAIYANDKQQKADKQKIVALEAEVNLLRSQIVRLKKELAIAKREPTAGDQNTVAKQPGSDDSQPKPAVSKPKLIRKYKLVELAAAIPAKQRPPKDTNIPWDLVKKRLASEHVTTKFRGKLLALDVTLVSKRLWPTYLEVIMLATQQKYNSMQVGLHRPQIQFSIDRKYATKFAAMKKGHRFKMLLEIHSISLTKRESQRLLGTPKGAYSQAILIGGDVMNPTLIGYDSLPNHYRPVIGQRLHTQARSTRIAAGHDCTDKCGHYRFRNRDYMLFNHQHRDGCGHVLNGKVWELKTD